MCSKKKNYIYINVFNRIHLQNVHFIRMRRQKEDCHEFIETKLLKNFAQIILEILGCKLFFLKLIFMFSTFFFLVLKKKKKDKRKVLIYIYIMQSLLAFLKKQ